MNSLVKPFVVVAWLTTSVVNATDDVQKEVCKTLTYKEYKEDDSYKEKKIEINNWEWKIKTVNENNETSTFNVKIENWIITIYMPETCNTADFNYSIDDKRNCLLDN